LCLLVPDDDEAVGDDGPTESQRRSPFKMSEKDFERLLERVVDLDLGRLKLNCVSTEPIEFFQEKLSDLYTRNMNERSFLRWQPGDGDHIELQDPYPPSDESHANDWDAGTYKLVSPIGGSFLLHPGGVIPGVQVLPPPPISWSSCCPLCT
jgi:hypothetical protein